MTARPTLATDLRSAAYVAGSIASLAFALALTGPGQDDTADRPAHAAQASPQALDCRLGTPTSGGTQMVLTNTSAEAIARGGRIAWATRGTPDARGGIHRLPQGLASGESLVIDTPLAVHAAGCLASVRPDPERPAIAALR